MTTAGLLVFSLLVMFLVRPDLGMRGSGNGVEAVSGGGKVGKSVKAKRRRQQEERGRSRVSKDLRRGIGAGDSGST
jgi:hypothetical protein